MSVLLVAKINRLIGLHRNILFRAAPQNGHAMQAIIFSHETKDLMARDELLLPMEVFAIHLDVVLVFLVRDLALDLFLAFFEFFDFVLDLLQFAL
jgi:hypothetical protein